VIGGEEPAQEQNRRREPGEQLIGPGARVRRSRDRYSRSDTVHYG
jgi:hypothetical protein